MVWTLCIYFLLMWITHEVSGSCIMNICLFVVFKFWLKEMWHILCYCQVAVANSLLDSSKNRPWSKHSKKSPDQPQPSLISANDSTAKPGSNVWTLMIYWWMLDTENGFDLCMRNSSKNLLFVKFSVWMCTVIGSEKCSFIWENFVDGSKC